MRINSFETASADLRTSSGSSLLSPPFHSSRLFPRADDPLSFLLLLSEFNYHRDSAGNCVLFPTASALSPLSTEEEQCPTSTDGFWYERTNVRRIPFSSCIGGSRPDRGKQHTCPGTYQGDKKSSLFWWTVVLTPFAFAGLGGLWWVKKGSLGGG